jgi:hypothetical protein
MDRKARLYLLSMYEEIWSKGNFTKESRSATVIPILKPGKNPSITESYRPISPTSCLWKFLERIVNKRLVYILEESNLLPSQQYGFRKNRSITDVLTIRENNIAEAIKKKQLTAMVSLYISKAYDMCWRYNKDQRLEN